MWRLTCNAIQILLRLFCLSKLTKTIVHESNTEKERTGNIERKGPYNQFDEEVLKLLQLFFAFGVFLLVFQSAHFFQLLIQYPLDLSVYTAKFITGPLFQSFVGIVINPYNKTFFRTHSCFVLD